MVCQHCAHLLITRLIKSEFIWRNWPPFPSFNRSYQIIQKSLRDGGADISSEKTPDHPVNSLSHCLPVSLSLSLSVYLSLLCITDGKVDVSSVWTSDHLRDGEIDVSLVRNSDHLRYGEVDDSSPRTSDRPEVSLADGEVGVSSVTISDRAAIFLRVGEVDDSSVFWTSMFFHNFIWTKAYTHVWKYFYQLQHRKQSAVYFCLWMLVELDKKAT